MRFDYSRTILNPDSNTSDDTGSSNELPPDVSIPASSGLGLLCDEITSGKLYIVALLVNRTQESVDFEFNNTHVAFLKIEDANGNIFILNDHIEPPVPEQQPITVEPFGEHFYVLFIDEAKYEELSFDASCNPYKISIELNSPTHPFSASVVLNVPEDEDTET